MKVDPIEDTIGRFGSYQTFILVLMTLGRLPTEFQLTNVVFLLPEVKYQCLDNNVTDHCPCEDPDYDESTIVNSVTSTWHLICGRRSLASLAQSIVQLGILAGSILFGYLSDRYGRRMSIVLALFLEAAFVTVSAIVSDFWMFLVCRLLIGCCIGGTMLCCFVLLIELSGKSFRAYSTGLNEIAHILGYIILPIIAYFVRDWRNLQLLTSSPWLYVALYYWLIPESPLWLITVGRKQEAIDILINIAKKNNIPTDEIGDIINGIENADCNDEARGNYADLFKTPKIRRYSIIMALVWLCCSHTFFGLNQYIGRLEGDLYLNVIISAVSLVPGLLLCVILTVVLRRKTCVIISFSTAALSLVSIALIPAGHPSLILASAIIGEIGTYSAFVQIYLFASEIFPTVVRNSAMGFSSVFARFGAFIAPFVVNIGIKWIAVLIFSSFAFLAAILCCFLPETKGLILNNTIKQTEELDSSVHNSP